MEDIKDYNRTQARGRVLVKVRHPESWNNVRAFYLSKGLNKAGSIH